MRRIARELLYHRFVKVEGICRSAGKGTLLELCVLCVVSVSLFVCNTLLLILLSTYFLKEGDILLQVMQSIIEKDKKISLVSSLSNVKQYKLNLKS